MKRGLITAYRPVATTLSLWHSCCTDCGSYYELRQRRCKLSGGTDRAIQGEAPPSQTAHRGPPAVQPIHASGAVDESGRRELKSGPLAPCARTPSWYPWGARLRDCRGRASPYPPRVRRHICPAFASPRSIRSI